MESHGPWKLTKAGFWLGTGFIAPLIVVYILWTFLSIPIRAIMQTVMTGSQETFEAYIEDRDVTKQLHILQFRESKHGNQLLILGTVENTGEKPANSIKIEAELLDETGQMVYECSTYISKKLKGGEKENFLIKCGCGEQPVPKHKSASVRVVSASNY